jgi:hypothetical protein
MVTEVGLENREARSAQQGAVYLRVGAARRRAWSEINGRTSVKSGQEGRHVAQAKGVTEIVAELAEIA